MESRLAHSLAIYPIGAFAGAIAPLVEWAFSGQPPSMAAIAGFSMIGGLMAAVTSGAASWVTSGTVAHRLAVFAAGVVVTLELLFYLNVVLLPDATFTDPKSVGASVLLSGVILGGLTPVGMRIARRLQRRRSFYATAGLAMVVVALVLVASRWPGAASVTERVGHGPNILVVVIDAARRDHLSAYGYHRDTSPFLDTLAAAGRTYDGALAASSWTRASVPVILGVRGRADREGESIQDILAVHGYTTGCFSDNPVLEQGSNVSAGFDYTGLSVPSALQFPQRVFEGTFVGTFVLRWPFLARLWSDERLVTKAIDWASRVKGPIFLYVHLMDAHMPYKRTAIDGREWRSRRIESPRAGMRVTAEEREDIIAHYDGGLRSADRQVARLVAAAKSWGRPLFAIITADHGESLGEGGRWGHLGSLSPELLGVPLVVIGEGVVPGRVSAPVGHGSVGRTVISAAGLTCVGCEGTDLRVSEGDEIIEGALPPNLYYRVAGGYKLVWDSESGVRELFHLATDPLETRDLAAEHPEIAAELHHDLRSRFQRSTPTPDDLERLRALGYVSE